MIHFHGIFQSRIFQKYSVSKLFPRSIFHLPNFHFSFPRILKPVLFISDYSSEVFFFFNVNTNTYMQVSTYMYLFHTCVLISSLIEGIYASWHLTLLYHESMSSESLRFSTRVLFVFFFKWVSNLLNTWTIIYLTRSFWINIF